jgi:gamma-butyrobetaine dioxygenase
LTGEAEDPLDRPGYPVNAGRPSGETDPALFGLPAIWLRYNCPCARCRDPATGERLVSITDLAASVWVRTARRSGDRIEIVFGPDGHRGAFDGRWLGQFAVSRDDAGGATPSAGQGGQAAAPQDAPAGEDGRTEDAKRLWYSAEIGSAFPQGSWPLFLAQASHRQACLAAVLRDGFIVLRDVPREPGAVLAVAESMGFVRETEHGRLIDVQVGARPPIQPFTCLPLPPGSGQPYRDPMPTLELMHCLDKADQGGESTLVDGFRAAATLRARDPDAFAVLAGTAVTFAYADARTELRATRPVIGVDPRGRIREIRFDGRSMQPPRLPPADITAFYAAYRALADLIGRPDLTLVFRLTPGDCLILDTTRILHGRTGFTDTGKRHLQLCWSDLDRLASKLALMRRESGNGKAGP